MSGQFKKNCALSPARKMANVSIGLALGLAVLLVMFPAYAENSQSQDVARLSAGVNKIAKPGVPGPVACVSENSFPVVLGKTGAFDQAVIAATRFGKGRVVAFGHGGFLQKPALDEGDTGKLFTNAAQWAARVPHKRPAKPVAGLVFALDIATPLENQGFEVKFLRCPGWKDQLADIDLLIGENIFPDKEHEQALADFVNNGGGFITSGLAWGWMQLNPQLDLLRDHTLNRVLAPMGIAFIDGYIDEVRSDKIGDFQWLRRGHALDALSLLESSGKPVLTPENVPGQPAPEEQALAVALAAYRWLPEGDRLYRPRVKLLAQRVARPIVPTRQNPLRKTSLSRLALNVDHMNSLKEAADSIRPADSAADYPGTAPDGAPRVSREVDINAAVPGWASTGLWAMAGEAVEINIPEKYSEKGFYIRIGCHTDKLWHLADWCRHPEISRSFPAKAGRNQVANPHGGLIYIEVPRLQENDVSGTFKVQIAGGVVEAPLYVLGKTDSESWRRLRNAPAPWGELQCERVTLTLPSEFLRSIEDPKPLMEFWNKMIGYYVELGSRPLDRRPQRFVADRQISVGWMHAGYPIMANIDISPKMVNLKGLSDPAKDVEGAWGFWHEMGHNHQRPEWTFSGSGEVTCNLFSLFIEEKIRGIAPRNHPWFKDQANKISNYLSRPDFEVWKKDPALGLLFFVEMQDAFGWKAFQQVFASYAATPDHELPRTDEDKRDQWLIRMSRATGKNLAPHFDRWRVPVSASARKAVAHLPPWRP